MGNTESMNDGLITLKCANNISENEHICKDPLPLSCGHYICNSCLKQVIDSKRCNICNKEYEVDLDQDPRKFNLILDKNLDHLFQLVYDRFKKTLKECKDTFNNSDEVIENHIEFTKQEIQICIESIKLELDGVYDDFCKELDEIKNKWKCECNQLKSNLFNQTIFDQELIELENKIQKEEHLIVDSLYDYQNELISMQEILKKYNESMPKLEFTDKHTKIDKYLIGNLYFEKYVDIDTKIMNRMKENKYEKYEIQCNPYDFCILSNHNLLVIDYDKSNLVLFNSHYELIKRINEINNKPFRIVSVAFDGNSNLYFSDTQNHKILKTDFELNFLDTFGDQPGNGSNQIQYPWGLAYSNQHVYICDYANQRIQKITSNMKHVATFPLKYHPWSIRCINNTAMVRAHNKLGVYFYNLKDNFSQLMKYDGHNGMIGASDSYFYEYVANEKTFYCYKQNGELLDQIKVNHLNLLNSWGSINIYKAKLYIVESMNTNIVSF